MPINEPLGDVRTARLELSGHIGDLEVEAAGAGSQDLLSGKTPASSRLQVENVGQSASIWLMQKGLGRLPWISPRDTWELRLNPSVAWTLHVDADLGEGELDLTDLRVQELQLGGHVGRAQGEVAAPRAMRCRCGWSDCGSDSGECPTESRPASTQQQVAPPGSTPSASP